MKKTLFAAAAVLLFAAACTPQDAGTTASLEVFPTSLTFGAEDTAAQEITVTATGVEWSYTVPSSADWISVDDGTAGKLLVSVAANTSAEERTASITIKPTDNDDIKTRSVTVTQKGSDNPEVYSLTVEPASLTFASEGVASQTVKVIATGSGITWSAAVEDAAKEWITLSATEGAEGETTLSVTVYDNPETAERSANIVLTPGEETVGQKAIRVTQEAKVLPPSFSMSYEGGDLPEDGFVFDYTGGESYAIDVTAVNIEWDVKTVYDEGASGWLTADAYKSDNVNRINMRIDNSRNESPDPRTARVVVTTDAEGIGPFEIPVVQEGKPEFLSTLEEDLDFGKLTNGYVLVYPNNENRNEPVTRWDLRFWNDGIEYQNAAQPYSGTGDRLNLYLYTGPITANDDNEYYLPDGTYTVVAYAEGEPEYETNDIEYGVESGAFHFPFGSWYVRLEDSAYTDKACIRTGTAVVSRSGESYTIVFDFVSDAGYKVAGSYEGIFDLHVQP